MFLEWLVSAANDLFARFWLVVIVVLPFLLILGLIMNWLEK